MASRMLLLLSIFLSSSLQSSSRKIKTTDSKACKNFYEYACGTSGERKDWFSQTTAKNTKTIKKLLGNKHWNRTILLDRKCDKVKYFEELLEKLGALTPKNVSAEKVALYNLNKQPKYCLLLVSLEGEGGDAVKALQRIDEIAKIAKNKTSSKASRLSIDEKWLLSFFEQNSPVHGRKDPISALEKAKLFYQKCTSKVEGFFIKVDREGVSKVSKRIKGFGDRVRNAVEDGEEESSLCKDTESDLCATFTHQLAVAHKTSAMPLFALRVIDLLKTAVESEDRIAALIQPHFIGAYDREIRANDCSIEGEAMHFSKTSFDASLNSKDGNAFERFKELARISEKKLNNDRLEEIVVFEKNLFKYSLSAERARNHHNLEMNSTLFSLKKLLSDFPEIADWEGYFSEMFAGLRDDESGTHVVVVCKSYFYALNKLMRQTPPGVIIDYMELATMFSLNSKFPQVLPPKSRMILGLKIKIDCGVLAEASFPHVVGRLLWDHHRLQDKKPLVDELVKNLVASFEEMIDASEWMTRNSKTKAKRKAENLRSIIGIPPGDLSTSFVNDQSAGVTIEDTFLETLVSVKRNNFRSVLRTLFDDEAGATTMRTLPNEANASYDIRENLFTVNAGLLLPPFLNANSSEKEVYANLGFVAGHEITHSVGLNGMMFGLDGVYRRKVDAKTMRRYHTRLDKLKDKADRICELDIGTRGGKTPELIKPDFRKVKEEEMADLGGFKLAMMAYEKKVGEEQFRKEASSFIDKIAEMFCGRLSTSELRKMTKKSFHPPDYCRLNILSHTKEFAKAKKCYDDQRVIEMW